jgi:NAD(P)H-nitrite reductase large subunit
MLHSGEVKVVEVVDASAGRLVTRAEGERTLARVQVSGEGQRVVEADALVLAYGRLPENQLARLAGCQIEGSQWVQPRVVRDAWMRTSAPGVLVAGDAGGIVGEALARAQGRRAGLAAAPGAGLEVDESPDEAVAQTEDAPPVAIYALADAETVICRCEDVTAGQIAERIFPGSLEPGPVVAESRAGMGRCQGRNCACMIAAVIGQHTGQPIERIPPITARPPVLPVPLGALAERPPDFEAD